LNWRHLSHCASQPKEAGVLFGVLDLEQFKTLRQLKTD
jgi:hypothetical protein